MYADRICHNIASLLRDPDAFEVEKVFGGRSVNDFFLKVAAHGPAPFHVVIRYIRLPQASQGRNDFTRALRRLEKCGLVREVTIENVTNCRLREFLRDRGYVEEHHTYSWGAPSLRMKTKRLISELRRGFRRRTRQSTRPAC